MFARMTATAALLTLGACGEPGQQACDDFAEVLTTVSFARCSLAAWTSREVYEGWRKDLGCAEVVGVADEGTLREQCFKEVEGLSCDQLVQLLFPLSCHGKLIYGPP